MNKKLFLIIIIILLITPGCKSSKKDNPTNNQNITNNIDNNEEINNMKLYINEKEYIINLENNETVKELLNQLPLELNMQELNGNEKYTYLESDLPTNASNPKHINTGDVMLYGNNCLVIFYKSFNTSYSYTKIGHIDNLPNLGKNDINIKLTR